MDDHAPLAYKYTDEYDDETAAMMLPSLVIAMWAQLSYKSFCIIWNEGGIDGDSSELGVIILEEATLDASDSPKNVGTKKVLIVRAVMLFMFTEIKE